MRGSIFLKKSDYIFGRLLIIILYPLKYILRKKRTIEDVNVKSVGVLKTAAIGDTVLLLGVIEDIKARYECAKIIVFCSSGNAAVCQMVCDIEVVVVPVSNPFKSISIIRGYSFDVFIDYGAWPRIDALLTFFSRSLFKVGFNSANQGRHYLYDMSGPHKNDVHELENYKNLSKLIGVESTSKPSVSCDPHDLENLAGFKSPYAVLHMYPSGSGVTHKVWLEENWVKLISYINDNGLRVLLTGGPSDRQKIKQFITKNSLNELVEDVSGTTIPEVVCLLSQASFVISVNTGIMHLSCATGSLTVSLNGPTNSNRWGAFSQNSINIDSKLEGCPYLNYGFEFKNSVPDCMGSIYVKEVIEVVQELIEKGKFK